MLAAVFSAGSALAQPAEPASGTSPDPSSPLASPKPSSPLASPKPSSPLASPKPSSPLDCAPQAAARVQARYDTVQDLRAEFEQVTDAAALAGTRMASAEPSRGSVVLAKPGRMRWEYREPEPSLVVSDGRILWMYDPAAREVQRLVVEAGYMSGAALQFLLGGGKIDDEFRVEAERCEPATAELRLLPRRDASYERLGLTIDRASGDILETTIVDLFGNETRIRFDAMRVNTAPAKTVFEFQVPAGVEVLDLVPAS